MCYSHSRIMRSRSSLHVAVVAFVAAIAIQKLTSSSFVLRDWSVTMDDPVKFIMETASDHAASQTTGALLPPLYLIPKPTKLKQLPGHFTIEETTKLLLERSRVLCYCFSISLIYDLIVPKTNFFLYS